MGGPLIGGGTLNCTLIGGGFSLISGGTINWGWDPLLREVSLLGGGGGISLISRGVLNDARPHYGGVPLISGGTLNDVCSHFGGSP